jgi:hypothetical protein
MTTPPDKKSPLNFDHILIVALALVVLVSADVSLELTGHDSGMRRLVELALVGLLALARAARRGE